MSGKRNIPNDGQALTTPDVQRIGDGAASADDRVHEVMGTPPSLGAKTIMPTSVETAAVNPRLLCAPGVANGTVQLNPCAMQAGSPSNALGVALQATLKAALASALFSSNSSGSTRYDLLYATVQRTVDLTGPRAIKSTADGTVAVNPSVNLEDAPTVTLTILSNVGNVTPLATMPADNNGGSNGEAFGSYNFPIALIAIANGFTSGSPITQAMITQMWSGGWLPHRRRRTARSMSLYYGAAGERPGGALQSQVQGAERWGAGIEAFVHFKLLSTTGNTPGTGVVLDNSIDWRQRFIQCSFHLLSGTAAADFPLESLATELSDVTALTTGFWSGAGSAGGNGANFSYSGPGGVCITVDATGQLVAYRLSGPASGANGDPILVFIRTTDQFVANA